jgi:NAD(P)-dependent dehydrogenase (short-subunit alcohol dehydrogenase family)
MSSSTYFITGCNRGLGLEFVQQLLARGERVIATCRDIATATDLTALTLEHSGQLSLVEMDVSDEASMREAVALLNDEAIDVFINNAGVYGPRDANFGNVDGPAMAEVLYTNAVAPVLLTQLLIDNVRKGSGKKLVYVSSKMGSIADNGRGGSYIYRSSKTALNSIVKSLALDFAPEGIAAATLHPGWVRTDMGGPNGLIDAPESVSGMLNVIDGLSVANTGQFFNYDGATIAW